MSEQDDRHRRQVKHFEVGVGLRIYHDVTRIFGKEFYDEVVRLLSVYDDDENIAAVLDTYPSVVGAIRWQRAFAQEVSPQ